MSISAPDIQKAEPQKSQDGLRVMMVDDSVVIRGLVSKWLSEREEVSKVDTYRNGRHAVEALERDNPDIVILDIEMPEMDGIEALQNIKRMKPHIPVIMASSLTQRNAEISLRALSLGATDYIPKPESNSGVTTSLDFRRSLIAKTIELGRQANCAPRSSVTARRPQTPDSDSQQAEKSVPTPQVSEPQALELREASLIIPRILAIGSSTGGPIALSSLLKGLGSSLGHCPIIIAQHMPTKFTAILAKQLANETGRPCAEGQDGEEVLKGHIYIAPGGKHMVIKKNGAVARIAIEDGPLVNFCKPAVDPLFNSVAQVYGNASLAVILTGMGSDGCEGAKGIVESGGTVLTQDEETSVVWGMPGAVANAGVCSAILPLEELPMKITKLMKGMRT